ncbi:glycosylase [Cyclobacterium sp. 1_MG-2023]|uniref:glycosylase n=1 Tax=Cyclobacterium sp. 1_MG-2023 TaxID=3062681 RepID=UPI0026E30225|nr:glycosylase [Cyclobacterium sp. 1_MG-2023]MDO6439924.1 glycosylase [Cyclobacterium sp. 1_MG-2023]
MKNNLLILFLITLPLLFSSCSGSENQSDTEAEALTEEKPKLFPDEITKFTPLPENPIFTAANEGDWDSGIRERGFIMKEEDGYHMWYTGFDKYDDNRMLKLGYAFSEDGIEWTRYKDNPIFSESWVEDMMVWKEDGVYYMFAEGRGDIAKMLTSTDRIHWENQGDIDIRKVDGSPISDGPYGTPTVWVEDGVWYLFYERGDLGIWLATSKDRKVWTNVQDDPIIKIGPEAYDKYGVAVNKVIKYQGNYYAYYHATSLEDWSDWTMNMAVSPDLKTWTKYSENPIMGDNKSSGFPVYDGEKFRFYTMHPEVVIHYPSK